MGPRPRCATLIIMFEVDPESVTTFEPHREKTGFLPRRKQRRRSASQLLRS